MEKDKKPWYKRWWAIALFIFVGIGILQGFIEQMAGKAIVVNNQQQVQLKDSVTANQTAKQQTAHVTKDVMDEYNKKIDAIRNLTSKYTADDGYFYYQSFSVDDLREYILLENQTLNILLSNAGRFVDRDNLIEQKKKDIVTIRNELAKKECIPVKIKSSSVIEDAKKQQEAEAAIRRGETPSDTGTDEKISYSPVYGKYLIISQLRDDIDYGDWKFSSLENDDLPSALKCWVGSQKTQNVNYCYTNKYIKVIKVNANGVITDKRMIGLIFDKNNSLIGASCE